MRISLVFIVLLLLLTPVLAENETTTTIPETTTTIPETTTTIPETTTTIPETTTTLPETTTTLPETTTTIPETTTTIPETTTTTVEETTTTIPDLCANIVCPDARLQCPDGYTALCSNACDPATGLCSACIPDCAGHQLPSVCGNNMCEAGEDDNNCPQDCGYECPLYTEPSCPNGHIVYGDVDPVTGCRRPATCCGDYVCSGAEDSMNCEHDCKEQGVYCGNGICEVGEKPESCPQDCGMYCSEYKTCPDGRNVRCFKRFDRCECEPCDMPTNCRSIVDESGFTHVVCEARVCPEIPTYEKEKCIDHGGNPVLKKDPSGCEYVDCQFTEEMATMPISIVQMECPSPEEMDEVSRKCEDMGMKPLITVEGGCRFVKCMHEDEEVCPMITFETKMQIEERCRNGGLEAIKDFDNNGCPIIRCGGFEDCRQEPPPEMYDKCNYEGGEVVVRRDPHGCIVFARCIMPGDENDVYFENINKVPETSKLLSMAFKLESLKIELDGLARRTDEIADYYASVGSNEQDRFRRVSDMFDTAKDKVDEIKNKLRDRLEHITVDDIMEIKHDIRYIKDVVMKDILYVMLSTSEDVKNIGTGEGDCGNDEGCFDRALRVCKPVTYYPSDGPIVNIIGLEDDKCVIKAELPEGEGPPAGAVPGINPPYTMTCKIEEYSMDIRNPETDILPYCEGSLMELMKKFGEGPKPQYEPEEYKPAYEEPSHEPGQPQPQTCVGCLNNGVCDPGECRDCPDCIGGGY